MENLKENHTISKLYIEEMQRIILIDECKKTLVKIVLCFTLVVLIIMSLLIPQIILAKENSVYCRPLKYATDMKYILFLTHPKHNKGNFVSGKLTDFTIGQNMFVKQNCPQINCYITRDRNLLAYDEDYDAIVFDMDEIKNTDIHSTNLTRSFDQIYVFRSLEPSGKHTLCGNDFDSYFNLTWTYKLNSDFPQPFYDIFDENNNIVGPKSEMKWIEVMKHNKKFSSKILSKTKAVAWIVYKCKSKSKHEHFINSFRNVLEQINYTLDTFGPCGEHKCSQVAKCQTLVEKDYFFQLVFEEHIAEDYVTEEMATVMNYLTVPITVGPQHYNNFLPPGSYINTHAFDVDRIGSLVNYLIQNKDKYEYFLDWKNHYHYKKRQSTPICHLCQKLNEKKRIRKTYKNFRQWWDPKYEDVCERIRLYKYFEM